MSQRQGGFRRRQRKVSEAFQNVQHKIVPPDAVERQKQRSRLAELFLQGRARPAEVTVCGRHGRGTSFFPQGRMSRSCLARWPTLEGHDRSPEEQFLIRPALLEQDPDLQNVGSPCCPFLVERPQVSWTNAERVRVRQGVGIMIDPVRTEKTEVAFFSFRDTMLSGRCYSPTERLKSTCQCYCSTARNSVLE